ncbi:MAG TPA: transposase [Gemmataceae bacterium]|nr:transposase [Gemmataceae bacterium]
MPCRLTARRCPPEVAARRQKLRADTRSQKGRDPSARQLALWDWLVLATNVPAARLTAAELGVVYRCRWQVELLFKRGKQQLRWTFSHGRKGVLVEVLAWGVVHWAALRRCGPLGGVSPVKLFAVVRRYALRLAGALRRGRQLRAVLAELVEEMGRVRRQPKRYTRPSTRQLLEDPELAA